MADERTTSGAGPARPNARELLARLAEQERVRGHHSAEGKAIRTLSRALSGWAAKRLSAVDVIVMCDQAMIDWLSVRLGGGAWSREPFTALVARAAAQGLIAADQARRLRELHAMRRRLAEESSLRGPRPANMLRFCINLIEPHW
jgi:hypothetical protein